MSNELRLKRMQVNSMDLINLPFYDAEAHMFMAGRALNVPAGTSVRSVYHDVSRDGFTFILENPEWDPVPEGQIIPWLYEEESMVFETVAINLRVETTCPCCNAPLHIINSAGTMRLEEPSE